MDSFTPSVPYHLIQGIRLAHSLMESRFQVCIPSEHEEKFTILREKFGAKFQVGSDGIQSVDDLRVVHSDPLTTVGSIERPLIFPHAIVSYCKSLWKQDRPNSFSFAGLLTDKRRTIIEEWVGRNFPAHVGKLQNLDSRWTKWLTRLRLRSSGKSIRIGDLRLWSNDRGRTFPIKSWDEDYFRLLAGSRFVLCPNGDYTWSYRFYEAILCGAIPVVEATCGAYDGFQYRMMSEPAASMRWDPQVAAENYRLCSERLTIPRDQLDSELGRLLEVSGSRS